MDLYNVLLLCRHPIFRPIRDFLQLSRPSYELWTHASRQGYGAHLGEAESPIAIFRHKLSHEFMLSNRKKNGLRRRIRVSPIDTQAHEPLALYHSLQRWRPLLRGSTINAYTSNAALCVQFNKVDTVSKPSIVLNAIWELVKDENIELTLGMAGARESTKAQALSEFAHLDDPRYTTGAAMLLQMGRESANPILQVVKGFLGKEYLGPMDHSTTPFEHIVPGCVVKDGVTLST
jgi:hypothetical protein